MQLHLTVNFSLRRVLKEHRYNPPVTYEDLLPPDAPEIGIGCGDMVSAWVGNCEQPSFGIVYEVDLANRADGRDWFHVQFNGFALWLTTDDDCCALRLELKADTI